jgi:hypothetical protein
MVAMRIESPRIGDSFDLKHAGLKALDSLRMVCHPKWEKETSEVLFHLKVSGLSSYISQKSPTIFV